MNFFCLNYLHPNSTCIVCAWKSSLYKITPSHTNISSGKDWTQKISQRSKSTDVFTICPRNFTLLSHISLQNSHSLSAILQRPATHRDSNIMGALNVLWDKGFSVQRFHYFKYIITTVFWPYFISYHPESLYCYWDCGLKSLKKLERKPIFVLGKSDTI